MHKDVLLLHVPNITHNKKILQENAYMHQCGLFSICNELNKNNIKSEIINLALENDIDDKFSIYEYIKINKFKIIAFSLHWFFQIYDTIETAKKIKQIFPNIYIVFGGYTASCYAFELLERYNFIDYIIKGEGEIPCLKLSKYLLNDSNTNISKIPNLLYKHKDKIRENQYKWFASSSELDNFDFGNLKQMKNYQNFYNTKPFYITAGRGCNGNCACCGGGEKIEKKFYNRFKISIRNPIIIANEIFKLNNRYDINNFSIAFDPYPEDSNVIKNIIELSGKKLYKKISINIECFKLPDFKLIDAVSKYLNKNSIIVISPDFAQENLRKLYKSFYFSNKNLYDILYYMESKGVISEIFFSSIYDTDIQETEYKEKMIKYLLKNFRNIKNIITGYTTFDPYSPITINPKKYYFDTKNEKFNFEYYLNYWKNH